MAGSILSVAVDQIQYGRLGYCAVSLTHLDDDLEPAIREGSKIEIGGSLIDFPADEAILGWAGIANSSMVYIYIATATLTPTFTITPPLWSPTKQAWYNAGETNRYIPWGLYKDASGAYSIKEIALENPGDGVGRYRESIVKTRPGWLYCDGTVIDKSASPHLSKLVYMLKKEAGADAAHPFYDSDANKARLPDVRDRHLRGMPDAGRKSGDYQADAVLNHQHDTTNYNGPAGGSVFNDLSWNNYGNGTHASRSGDPVAGGATENRVKNIAAYVLIKW